MTTEERIAELESQNERLQRWKKLLQDAPGECSEEIRKRCLETDYMAPIIGMWREKVQSLEAQLAEARKDTARLNWLEKRGFSSDPHGPETSANSTVHSWRENKLHAWTWSATWISSEFRTCRAAIDAAMEKQP